MPVGDYCRRDVRTAVAGTTLAETGTRMREERLGCLVVLDADGKPAGVVTDRDLALRTLRGRLDARSATLDAIVVADDLLVVLESSAVRVAVSMMRKHGVRRLPVVDAEGRLVGIVAWDDLVGLFAQELAGIAATLSAQASPSGVPHSRALAEVIGS